MVWTFQSSGTRWNVESNWYGHPCRDCRHAAAICQCPVKMINDILTAQSSSETFMQSLSYRKDMVITINKVF